ncbi:hypothetical protein TWF694_007200 [Orbilia ellipsospora]|uniref:Zn(2)-C6 fungal-type domain-containing protein n=1 Tax=Orbilia ellipsospora TaxID=2528407 RepID=A0AAV9XKF3_9PEZI
MNSTMMQQPSNTATTSPTQIKTKRRRRAPPSGASEPCHTCRQNNRVCDRRRPYCTQCIETKGTCSGYRTQLTWGVGVASRGKLRGLSLPVPLSDEERAKKNSAMAAEKKEEKKKLKAAGNATNAGISKHSASASISSLASVRSMSSQDLATLTNMASGISYNSPTEPSIPQYQYPQLSSLNAGNHPPQFQKLMQAAHHAQGGLSLLLSPMDDMHNQHVEYHGDGTSTPEIYSPLYSPVDAGYLHSPVDIIHISQNRPHPPTSVPDHVSDFFEEESSVGQSSPSIHGHQEENSNDAEADGAISALLYDEEMLNNMYHYSRPNTAHTNGQFANGNTSPSTGYNSSPANSPSPPPLVHSSSFPNSHYASYSPNSAARPQQLTRLHTAPHPHLQLGTPTSYPPTPSSMSPSTPTTPIYGHCLSTPPPTSMPPTSAAGNPSSLTSPAVLLQQQLLQNQNAIMQQQQRHRLLQQQQQQQQQQQNSIAAADQQFYLSHLG